ncbi:MAG: plasmid partitioning protein RepB, partial [Pseudomonadota bacterium]
MARKNLLEGLMKEGASAKPASPAPKTAAKTAAIGAVSQSIADLKSRALIEIDADQIYPGGLLDRLEIDAEAHEALKTSLSEHGQQVPVLVRPAPDDPDRYQIVYGRRRVAALAELGFKIKALVRDLDDHALVLAQGQENSARQDLSFIEKAYFAQQMVDAGYKRADICSALHVDKTV